MPLDNSKLKKVYATLQQGGYQQDYNTFLKGFTGNDHYENRKKVYDLLSANGAQIGDTYEDFMKKMWVSSAPAKPAAPTTPAKETPTTPIPTNAEGTPLTEADRQKMLGNVDNMMAQSKAGLQRTKNRMDYAKANTGLRTPSVSLGVKGGGVHLGQNSKVVETKPQYNAERGKVERSYITESGNEYEERGGADLEQNAIDEARFQSEQQEAYLLREKQRIEQEMNQRGRELDAEAVDFSWRDMPRGSGGAIHTYNSTTVNGRFADTKYKSLLAQLNKVNDGLATLAEAKKGKASDQWIDDSSNWASKKGKQLLAFGAGAWRGLAHAVGKVSTWDMGMTDMATNGALYTAAVDADRKGIDNISREDRDLLDITAYTNAIQSENGQYLGRGYKAGQVTGESLPFMIEMMLNPASKLGTTATNKLMREAVKRYGKEAVKKATKKYLAAKIGTRLMGDAVGSMAMAGTTGQGHVTADMLNRLTGDVQFKVDDSGKIVYGGREGAEDSVLKAYLKAFGAQTIENHSEMVGEYFAPFLGKAASLTRKGMNKIGLGKVNKLIDDIGATNAAKMIGDFEKQTKWNGTIGEYAEEVVGNIENAILVGDNTLDTAEGTGVFNADQNIDTFLGVSLMGGFFAGAKTLSYRGPKRQALNEMSDAGKVIDNAIGDNVPMMEKWGGWRNTFLVGTDEEKKAALREVMDNTDLPIKFRMGVLNFVKAAQKYEGIVRAQESKVKEGEQDPVAQSSDESYDNGYDTTEPEAMNDAKNMYDFKRQQMSAMVTDEFLADFDNDPVGTLSQVMGRDDFSEDEKQLALDYVNAKATYDGMIDRVRDDIDSRIEESNATVNSRMNRNDGMIHPATLKLDDRKVYIVDGTINMQDDGSMVDVSNSSESILVRDAETGKLEFMSPSDVLTTDEAIDPAAEKEAAQQALREQYAQEQSDRIDGTLAFNVGDTYDLTDDHGQQWSAQIVADNGDGTVQVAWNGDPNSISTARKEDLQSMRDNHNLARLNEYEQQRAAQRQEQQAAAAEPQRRTYNLNDEITLRDEEGNPIRGSITAEENEDGEIEVYTEQPINGKQVQLLSRDKLDNMLLEQNGEVVEPSSEEEVKPSEASLSPSTPLDEGAASVGDTSSEEEGATLEPASATSEEQHTEEEPHTEPMPMIGEGEDAEPDFASVTPQRAHEYIFNESGLDEEDAKDFMANNLSAAQTAVNKIKNKKPKMGTSIAKFNKDKAEWQHKLDEANANLDYWQQVKAERNAVLAERAKAQQEADKKLAEEAKAAEAAYREEMAKKEAEQAALGTNTVSPAIRDKWNAAPKVEGAQNEIVLANGEKVAGRYYLVESGAATPSHNSANGFAKSEGFPVDENGGSVNDRDYERDKDAQQITRDIANKYDSRAMQTPVVVSQDGVVLSGNGRTMAGELAAAQGTDAEYNEHLAKYPTQYGFTSEQVKGMQHPRVVFVPDAAMPYTADTFAKFNQQEMKGQSKTEHSVKLGKVVDDETFNRIISLINRFDTLGDFYADFAASREAIGELSKCGAISRPQMAEMVDGDGLSAIGKETLENMLIGKAFESNPDAVREATEFKQMRQTIIQALAEISNNISLGKDYSLESELAEAIDLVYNARKSGFKAGDRVSSYARQQQFDFYGVPSTVADYKNATMLMIADILNDNRSTLLKKYLQLYNKNAKDAANGQLDIFSGTVASKESILNDVNELLNYGTEEEQKKAAQEAVEKRKAESVAEAGVVDNGSEGSNEDNDRVEETPAEQAPTNEEGSTPAMSHDEKMAFMRQFLEDTAGDMRLLDVVTDEEVQKLIDLYDAWEVVNDGLGAAHDANDALLNDKNKAIAQKAKENIETAENAANAAFAPVEDYYNELLNTHNIEDEEGDADEAETPSAETPLSDAISAAEAETDQNPTDGQKEAGNYKKGHVQVGTFDITIENPKGSVRRGKDANGKEWESKMNNTYGYFRGTEGVDGDHIDVFISNDIDGWDGRKVFVVDQYNPDGSFDEHKVMLGFNDADEAKSDYLANYEKGWENGRRIDVSAVNLEDFEKWIASSKRKTKPFSEYSSVKKETVGNSFDDFVRDSGGEVIPNGVTRSNVINFAERVLEKYPSHTESYGTYNAQRTDVEIPADKLFKSESDWFTAKNGNSIAVNDTQAKVCYELVAHKDAQGHLKSVSVIKYHSFDNALTDEEVVAITDAMKANATVAPTVEINDANWKESVDTPIGSVKMGENQKAKLFAKGREQQYGMLLETLSNPDVVLEEKDKEQNMFHERPSSYLFVKTFQKEDGSKYVHFESVTVSQEGMEVSISSHIIRENQLKNKLKSDRLLYKATALDAPANTSAEQPIVGGSLSSDGKDTEKDSSDQENGVKSFKITPKEYTTKRGKKLSMHLVTFESELSKEQMNAAKKLAKDAKGWWSKEDGGFLMRDMESAQKLADSILDDADAVADAQPVSLIDMKEAAGADVKKPKDSGNKLVTDERYAELKARMRKKLGQLNVGVDPEMLAIGTEMAVYHIEKGARKFTEYAKAMIEDLGEAIRPYLKAFYNGARDLPEVEANGWSEDLTPYDEVRRIDIANFDKPSVDAMATAEMVVKEQEAEQQAEETKKQISETRNKNRNETKQQTAADTQAITSEATAIASETESVIRTGEENAINEQVGKIDEALDKVNNQLALLGYYEADEEDSDMYRMVDEELEDVNETFNEELQQQIDGKLPSNHIYRMGEPGRILLSTGVPDLPIQMNASRLKAKATSYGHDFELSEIKDLVKSLQTPLAVFAYGDKSKAQNIIVPLQKDGKNFIVGLSLNPTVGGRRLEINSIRNVFPKNNSEWLNWISQGKALYLDKEKVQTLIDQQRTILADVEYLDLNSVAKIVESFENPKFSDENILREGHGTYSDEEISLENDPISKMLGKSRYTTRQRKEFALRERTRMAERAKELSEGLNLKNVDIVTDASTLSGDRRRAKGFYNKRTGRITIVVANHSSMSDIEQTLLHEAVAHYGLRELFGEQLDAFLDNVYQHAEPEIRSRITEMARLHGWDFRKATEEYLAGLAETTDFEGMLKGKGFYGWWSFVKRAFLDMLHKIGFGNYDGPELSDNELRYILWRSYENLKEPGRYRSILGEAEDISKQMDLKVGNFAENTDNSAASVADGDSYMYRDGRGVVGHVPDAVVNRMYEEQVKDTRNRTMLGAMTGWLSNDGRKRWKNKFAESYFDYTRSVKALQDAISEATGSKVEKNEDVWKSLNAKSSIDEREVDTMTRMLAAPLGNLISEMVKKSDGKYSLDDIEAYLNAKHGVEERNPYMLNQAVEKSLDMVRKDERLKALSEGYSSDEADAIAAKAVDDARSETMESARRDYSGLTGLFDPALEGKSIDELEDMARDYVSEIEDYFGKDVTDELWKRVNALNAYSLRKSYECGLLSKKQYDEVRSMYQYYVPLRGWHDGYAGDVYNYVTRGGDRSMIENALKKAYGRTSRAGDILGTMTAMANSAIVMGNKNKIAQTFMNLALNHDETGMFTISEAWYEKNASDDSYRLVTPKLSEDMSAEEVADAIATWEDEMQEKSAAGEAVVRSGKFAKDFQYNLEEWKEQQHCVRVLRNGKEYMVYINGNPRATQAINGLLNPDYSSGVADDFIRKYMRYKAQVQTSLSPKFMISNLQRDAATAVGGSYAKFGAGYAADVVKNLAGNIDDIFRLFHKDRTGTLDMNVAKDRWFKEFVEHGGMTGVSSIRKKDEYEAQYAKSVERAVNPKRSAPARGWKSLMDNIEFVNRCVENLTRFSVYMASRKAGKSVKDSVFDAKECSVNFNMKGSGAWGNATLRKYIMYANPALQSLRMISTWYDANKPRTIALLSSGVALGFLNALILSALCGGGGGDDDDNAYYALTDYNRHNYFNVGIGNRKFLHWRLPQEMVPLYAIGQIVYDRMSGRISNEQALHQTLVQLNNLSPMAFVESDLNYDMSANNTYAKTFVKAVTPDVLSDISDAYLWQEDFLGRSIGNRSEWNIHAPEWQRVDKRTPDFFVKSFEWLDKATGGTDHKRGGLSQVLNPSAVWYILEQQGGGLSQVAHEFYNAGLALMGGEGSDDLEAKDYPFVSKFMVDGNTDAARMRVKNEKFWMYRMEYEAKDAEIKSISRDPNLSFDEKAARISELADDKYLTMYSAVRGWKKLRKEKSLAETDGNKEEEQTAADNMKMLVDRTVRQIEKPSTIDWNDWDMDDIVDDVTVDDILDKIPDE